MCIRDRELTEIAVLKSGETLQYVPWNLRKGNCVNTAAGSGLNALQFITPDQQTEKMLKAIVYMNAYELRHIKPEQMTQAVIDAAKKATYIYLEYFPREAITKELVEKAVRTDVIQYQFVPPEI